ncbi:PREDICTED: uncharacterized protein KIAA1211 homolog [Myotis brandtii]|nr:PREDICTED: uncharacterized protein KIAA1211 homolog [Myotis brandtii]
MAMEEIKLTQNVHNEALSADVSDKKKGGKFQPFKKLFGKRKKKDTSISREAEAGRKSHSPQSVSNGTFSSDEETLEDSLRSFNYSMGARAFSHDSIFIPDGGAESEQTVQAMSQDNILGKVKTLQRQLGKSIKFGQPPPSATPMKRADSGEASLEGDPLLASPMEPVTQQDLILPDAENKSSDTPSSPSPPNPPGARSEMEEKAAPAKPSRPKRHFSSAGTIESVNLDAIPLAIARLDNSAAKHKLSVKPKNQRVSKKHRRLGLAGARPNEQGGLPSQLSLDQNGHPGEDKLMWHEEEPEPLDAEEEKRCQEEYWRELEAKCKRQKAEAAERRRLEEQRLRALEQRLWEENRRQELLEEEGEEQEEEEGEPQPVAGKRQCTEERRRLDEQGSPAPECREPEEGGPQEAGEQETREEEAERLQSLAHQELEARSRQEAEKRRQEAEERELKELRRLEELEEQRRREAEKQRLEEEERKRREEEEEQRLREEEERKRREEEEQRLRKEEEERKRREEEEQRLRKEEEERKRREEEERKRQEEEDQRQREEEENRTKDLRRRQEEEARRREELRKRQEEVEAQRRREAEREPQGPRRGEDSGLGADDRSPLQTACAGEPELLKPEKQRENAEAPRACGKQSPEAEPSGEPQAQRGDARGQDGCAGPEERGEARDEPAPRGRCDSRGTLRKTPPGNAKFSIMPAWQKFSDGGAETSKQSAGAESTRKRPGLGASDQTAPPPLAAESDEPQKGPENVGARQEPADTTEGCKFAKDLPSFLVPSPPYPPQKAVAQAEPVTASGSETAGGAGKPDPALPGGEEKASSPFGIKLRRTNYSLRFHCDQQAEQKKKKRNSSAGDSAEGGPPAPACTDGEKAAEGAPALKHGPSLPAESKQGPGSWKDFAISPSSPPPPAQPGPPPVSSQTPAPEHTKAANRMPMAQKPALAPKPSGQTPPTSPLCKLSRPYLVELLARRPGKPDPEPSELCKEGQERREPGPPSPPPPRREEKEEVEAERKAAAPALSAAPQEKPPQTPEAGRKEKPVLQSRHSLDGSKLVEKVETAQPLWITLALQKQKGFREQQATREERKQAREAKQAEKLSKDNVSVSPQPGSSSVSRAGSLLKSMAHPEDKKPETAGSRLERREQLKKANTLPTSVTVEISDSPPPAPLVKEVTKRFSTPDAAPVSTEPAWLALAKRKAKAWSDCPQIIK